MQLELWHLITLLLSFFSVVWAFGKILLQQIEKRLTEKFAAQDMVRELAKNEWDKRFSVLEAMARKTDEEVMNLKINLPAVYVQREDWIRFASTIETKMDVIYKLIWQMGGGKNERN